MHAIPQGVASYLEAANLSLSLSLVGAPETALCEVNERFCALTGYLRHEVIGRNCRFMQRHLTRQPGVMQLREFFADPNRSRVRVHLINFRADDTPFVNQLTLHRITGPGGTARLYLASQFDITDAAPSEIVDYDAELRDTLKARVRGHEAREILLGSIQSLAEAAGSITQARYLIDEADRAGMLGYYAR